MAYRHRPEGRHRRATCYEYRRRYNTQGAGGRLERELDIAQHGRAPAEHVVRPGGRIPGSRNAMMGALVRALVPLAERTSTGSHNKVSNLCSMLLLNTLALWIPKACRDE